MPLMAQPDPTSHILMFSEGHFRRSDASDASNAGDANPGVDAVVRRIVDPLKP